MELLQLKKLVWERDNFICHYCGVDTKPAYLEWLNGNGKRVTAVSPTVDHIVPRSKGGLFSFENLFTACYVCNNKRGNADVSEFEAKRTSTLF